jgi:hypothetical protein
MIRIIHKSTGAVCSTATNEFQALSIISIDADNLEMHSGDLLEFQKANAKKTVLDTASAYGDALVAGYPKSEQASWPVKIIEAKAILSGETRPMSIPTIFTECSFTNTSLADTASYILSKSAPFAMASGAISGIRQVAFAQIDDATTNAAINTAVATAIASLNAAFGAY